MIPSAEVDAAETQLIEAARAGDRVAISALLVRHQQSLRKFARTMCRTPEDADDAVQHTMIELATNASMFRGTARLTSWLFAIVRRECMRLIAIFRRDVTHRDDGVDAIGQDRALVFEIESALSKLAPDLREVLLLRDVEERSGPEVAQMIGISLEGMKSRLHRARRAMREALSEVRES